MKAPRKLEVILRRSLQRSGFLQAATLVVACSGGPDSTALLHALVALQPTAHLKLHVAHLNHDFRGQEAEDDARFAAQMAKGLGLDSTVAEADPMAYQREMGISSFEEAAREVRYRFLTGLAHRINADAIALGHTADDQAETILMHLIRGAGLPGLSGMREVSHWRDNPKGQSAVLFRPLLEAAKKRHPGLLPRAGHPFPGGLYQQLPAFHPQPHPPQAIPGVGRVQPADPRGPPQDRPGRRRKPRIPGRRTQCPMAEYVLQRGPDRLRRHCSPQGIFTPTCGGMALRRAFDEASGSLRRLSETHVKSMLALSQGPAGKSVHLPGGLAMRSTQDCIIIGPFERRKITAPTPDFEQPPEGSGDNPNSGWRITVEQASSNLDPKTLGATAALFDACRMGTPPCRQKQKARRLPATAGHVGTQEA